MVQWHWPGSHLGRGVSALAPDEWIMPLHRNLGVFTGRQMPLEKLFALAPDEWIMPLHRNLGVLQADKCL
ncbi:MAG: hypothetical protein WDM78_21660 [Puia sp.]